ncbi:MAG: hypothetical protein IKS99_01290 [Firmicutes bacterium]|nr:hypothetical protein [Bacillota bacterium]
MKKRILSFLLALMLAFTVIPALYTDSALAADSSSDWDTNNWVRIARDYTDYVQVGKYYYYYTNDPSGNLYKVYRWDPEKDKDKLLLKIKVNNWPEFYTNGEKLIYSQYKGGTIIKCKDIKTSKVKTILDLTKFKTSKSTDSTLFVHLYGKYLYYSKYRGLSTNIYKVYKVNINTGKQTVIKKGYVTEGAIEPYIVSGRYFIMTNKSGTRYIYDIKKKSLKKLADKTLRRYTKIDGYWYYVTCSNPSASTKTFKVWKRVENGSKKAKRIAKFTAKYTYDDLMELTDKGAVFLVNDNYSKEYSYSKKKFIKRKDKDVWYYINKAMFYD